MSEVGEADFAIPQTVLRHFDLSSIPYDDDRIKSVKRRRGGYPDNQLFIDRLLGLAEVDSVALYPPTSPAGYRKLLGSVHASALDRLKKDCLYYYLLRDRPEEESDVSQAEVFATQRCLSKTWRGFMDGYWFLDNGHWEAGVTALTNPAITEVNFPSPIIHTLASHAGPPSLACSLIHSFLLTRLPGPETPQIDIDIYTTSLAAATSTASAFSYVRSLPLESQSRAREVIWSWALGAPLVPCGSGVHVIQQRAVKEILHLPLTAEEDDHLLRFLLHPPKALTLAPAALSILHDLVTLRLIHQGKYAESLQLDKELAGSGGKEDDRQRRREMVREFIAILPEAQRRALAVDGEMIAGRREKEMVDGVIDVGIEDHPNHNDDMVIDPSPAVAVPAFPLQQAQPTPQPRSAPQPSAAASPAPRVVSSNSPFSGPPRFAHNPNLPSSPRGTPVQRVLSGSPFTLPMSKGANAVRSASFSRTPTNQAKPLPIPRPKSRPPIQDEEESRPKPKWPEPEEDEAMAVDSDGVEEGVAESEAEVVEPSQAQEEPEPPTFREPTPEPEPTPRTRRTRKQTTIPPQPQPAPTRRSSRQASMPTSPIHPKIPGTFETVPEDRAVQHQPSQAQGMPRSRTRRQLSAAPPPSAEVPAGGRSRMTRSASRATLGDPDEAPQPKRARSRRLSDASEVGELEMTSAATPAKRTTRRGGKSERGSPTPSVGGRSTRATSQTPRKSTRTRK